MENIDDETLAKLLLSIGTKKKWRPLNYIETAEILGELCKKSTQSQVARRLSVSPETVRHFLRLNKLSDYVKELIVNNLIGLDIAKNISYLDDFNEQREIADAVIKETLTTKEIRGIIQNLKKRNPDMSIRHCIDIALKYRPQIQTDDLVVADISDNTLQILEKNAKNNNVSINVLLFNILNEIEQFCDKIVNIELFGRIIFIIFNNTSSITILEKLSNKFNVKLEDIFDKIIRNKLEE